MSKFLLSLLLFAVGVGTVSVQSDSRPSPDAIWKGIKSLAEEEIRLNSPAIRFPEFDLKQVGSSMQLTVVKGGVDNLQFGNDPYELPFKKQILIEALRRALTDAQLSKAQASVDVTHAVRGSEFDLNWQRYLAQAESLVKEMVVQIESERGRDQPDAKLRELENAIDEILYTKVYSLVDQFAKSRQFNVISGRGGEQRKKFSVSVTTVPEGARLFIMTDLLYRKQLLLKTDPSQWPWLEIVQNPYELLGRYRYLTVWPGGKKVEGNIDVANGNPIKIQQL